MQLNPGERLGPYEIESLLGAGGMGEVYRARDPRLNRVVAVKVLPARSSDRPDARQRFEREARAISSLTHPHICTIYDVGEIDGRPYLVMEHLDGESLAERISRGPVPPSQAARMGEEICEALDAAHRQGTIHRDLKPANIMLTRSGVKLLDFGLAKLAEPFDSTAPDSPTVRQLTSEGVILGTLQYMAPEQIEGKPSDARTDIFAAGVVMYEMLTGRRPFAGASQAAVAAAIVHSDPPPISTITPLCPPSLERIIRPCLAKDPDERWQTARDVALQLKLIGSSAAHEPQLPLPVRKRPWIAPAMAGLLAGMVLASSALLLLRPANETQQPLHLAVALPEDQALWLGNVDSPIAISADGTKIAYSAESNGAVHIFLRDLRSRETTRVAGTRDGNQPSFKPDGTAIVFISNGMLRTVDLATGSVQELGQAGGPGRGTTWLDDGSIVWIGLPSGGLLRMWPETRRIERLTEPAGVDGGHVSPSALPGGKHILFTSEVSGKPFDEARIEIVETATKKRTIVFEGGMHPRLLGRDTLLFARGDALYSVPIDLASLRVKGTPREILKPLLVQRGTGCALYDVARDGTVIHVPYSPAIFDQRVLWTDRAGNVTPLPLPARRYIAPRISPNGKKLLIEIEGANDDIWVSDLARGTFSRLTFDHENLAPVWTADSQSVIFSRYSTGMPNLHILRADGSGQPRKIVEASTPMFPSAVSADGRFVGTINFAIGKGWDIVVYPATGGSTPVFRITTPFSEGPPDFSPDGRWITYSSDESGRNEIYVQPLDGTGDKFSISAEGGTEPLWSRDGSEIFYRAGNRIMSVPVSTREGFSVGKATLLFERRFETMKNAIGRNYDVSPDGRSFVFIEGIEAERTIRRIDVTVGGLP